VPELPEVETVRDGLERHVLGRVVTEVCVLRDSAVRRHDGGVEGFRHQLSGRLLEAAVRRGKYLWLPIGSGGPSGSTALVAHLGMSGQLLVRPAGEPRTEHRHLRVRLELDDGAALDFVDQRTFGHLAVTDLVDTPDGAPGGRGSALPSVPRPVAHIARDLLDPAMSRSALVTAVRARRTGIKRALLDQTLVSGVGNIYADEGLWRAGVHYARATDTMRGTDVVRVLGAVEEVMRAALAAGGTSFDALYVNVNGASGYFDRSLTVYGRTGRPCPRCGSPVRRDVFMNRSSFTCPTCQPRPRRGRW
jgi:formamidopyrimidine-DNA glycosylase